MLLSTAAILEMLQQKQSVSEARPLKPVQHTQDLFLSAGFTKPHKYNPHGRFPDLHESSLQAAGQQTVLLDNSSKSSTHFKLKVTHLELPEEEGTV